MTEHRKLARELAAESIKRGQPMDWFETLYGRAKGDEGGIPWADMTVNPNLQTWLEHKGVDAAGRKAMVVGCGLGDDAEALAALGFQVTAFDVSQTCIEWCRRRFPDSRVDYRVADLLSPPPEWRRTFDFVLEIYTLQALPVELREAAIHSIGECVATEGTLLVIARGRDETEDSGNMPWPLTRSELDQFCRVGLTEMNFEDFKDAEDPPVRRFRIEYRRTG